ncbi:DTW domain-containing protein [Haematococcus lacustris]|uniref:tRNA-uridine aminocarboxypropyltransferase 1 n=1 Tax=Haematococcus lacustris TaxID=44745 RepID=A0A699Z367_HAELA|nr:DTW domain-containing protein [Haematococcus lacustris]
MQASKNTGVHAAIIAPEDVTLHDLDHCPSFDPAMAVVLFPSDDAVEVQALQPLSLDRVFIIDSKWKKAKELNQHPALRGVRRVRLTHHRSSFWRFHTSGVADDGVCTIECMLLFLRALLQHPLAPPSPDLHAYDDLMWFFAQQHRHIQQQAVLKLQQRKDRKRKAATDEGACAEGP